jgi:hypothetical protein
LFVQLRNNPAYETHNLAGAPKISFREKNSGKEDARKIEQADRQRKGGAREIANFAV